MIKTWSKSISGIFVLIQVVVTVTNLLENQATSLHFHGMEQLNTPWMDGAGGISHCPINPLESFQYRYSLFLK